ncbi:trypsin-like peptidase domain-containing protein [Aquiluna borgnonia]|uniref:Trypsin-like peptidase domain-containing protein n=1 Tax=Aquiluna borgnonia TaxID=2499157 RepID=A0A7D4Q6Q2_9MICO|nr:trypsin-like peptidase domain-containing protein [Aquiluna borgnonia]QKJ25522.1 trypsin-like peptidase domain-containing protein [Aquiluna borgnonia]
MSEWNRSGENQFTFNPPYRAPEPLVAKRSRRPLRALGIATLTMAAALVGGIIGSTAFTLSYLAISQPAPVVVNNTEQVNWVTGAAANAAPSVATIGVEDASGSGSGSGVALTEDGYILTNAHVVTLGGLTDQANITVQLWNGEVYPAELVGYDSIYDLAVLKIDAIGLKPIAFADSDSLNVGEDVVAIGAPLGLSSTVTQGIISALNRTIQVASSEVSENPGLQFWNGTGTAPISLQVIQTDAAINPGNSGGALVNSSGELIGINVAIATAGNAESGSIGVGFAIPSNTAERIAQEIVETGSATHGLLGAMVSDNTAENSSFSTGAYVEDVTDGGAAQSAGIRAGDIVVRFGGELVASASDLTALVRAEPAGAAVEVEVIRSSERLTFQVTLGDAADLN